MKLHLKKPQMQDFYPRIVISLTTIFDMARLSLFGVQRSKKSQLTRNSQQKAKWKKKWIKTYSSREEMDVEEKIEEEPEEETESS